VHPPKFVPLDSEHERRAVTVLTELLVEFLARDTERDTGR
jgi:hypothetical protein